MTARVDVLGIRHHGPGSARSVAGVLDELRPDAVLIEGPADAGPLLTLAAAEAMVPPVALLAYAVDEPGVSAFWPFAIFSPEWQALTWALRNDAVVRFCDLPAAMVLAQRSDSKPGPNEGRPSHDDGEPRPDDGEPGPDDGEPGPDDGEPGPDDGEPGPDDGAAASAARVRADPLAMLSSAAGYDDPERWWDDVIESRVTRDDDGPGLGPFAAITEAMAELRAAAGPEPAGRQLREDQREAYMRGQLRAVLAEGAQRVVVVCGAWHTPALTGTLPSATADAKVLRGMAKRKVALTWVPWTHSRLAATSGYGAGITSPGWYHHLFTQPQLTVIRWLTGVAQVLRAEDLPVSSANVIEAVRLAETLAGLRGRQLAGLEEVTEATRAVLVDGDDVALALVTQKLVVGEALGEVPEGTPTVPLEADLRAQARRLRLKIEAVPRVLDLDLRKPGDLTRSQLAHRLALLDVPWAVPTSSAVQTTGTFRETWRFVWDPALSVKVIEAAMWGSTVEAAALARLDATASSSSTTLPQLTEAVEASLLADLSAALPSLLSALDDRAALDLDLQHLSAALPALVRAQRYGDVRGTDTSALADVADAVLTRICASLSQAVTSLDDDGATTLRTGIDGVQAAVVLLEKPDARQRWFAALAGVVDRGDVHGLLIGRIVRILRDAGEIPRPEAAIRLSRALSVGATPAGKAAWVEGFFSGGGLLLIHDGELLGLLDEWIVELGEQEFVDVLPLLRRTFGRFSSGERRNIAERVHNATRGGSGSTGSGGAGSDDGPEFDELRAESAMGAVALILGVSE